MKNTTRFATIALAFVAASSAHAATVCGQDAVFDASGVPTFPFGGEILGVTTNSGIIVDGHVDVTFTATGTFDAADIGFSFGLPVQGAGSVAFTGAGLGWSGQGTFTSSFPTSNLNGALVIPEGSPFVSWFVFIDNLAPEAGAITGSIDDLRFTVTFEDCPVGDVTGDLVVGFDDVLEVLSRWGTDGCNGPIDLECTADVDGSGSVGFGDLIAILSNWGDYSCLDCF